ncbi:hypothetical protein A1D22_01775 [Pasteurellaceae bacterium LFhippo2]|nr:hypothetical protein [Pasteurellaceae bacterium LFhippo2]
MPTIQQLSQNIYEQLHPLIGETRAKTYFSYIGIFKDNVMFGLYKNNNFYLYISESTLPIIRTYPDIYLLEDSSSGIHSKRYHFIPNDLLVTNSPAHTWINESIEELSQIKRQIQMKPRAIRTLPNMDNRMEKLLRKKLGIRTIDELNQKGEITICIEMIRQGIPVNNNTLFKLYGAINHQHICIMTDEEKRDLIAEAELALYNAGLPKRFDQV